MTKEERLKIALVRYQKGEAAKEICDELGLASRLLKRQLAFLCFQTGEPAKKISDDLGLLPRDLKVEVALVRYQHGESAKNICADLSMSPGQLQKQRRTRGIPPQYANRGERHWNWGGGRVYNDDGYIKIAVPDNHPQAGRRDKGGYVFEHRAVMAEHLKRILQPWETVHHKNGVRDDNRIENLQLRTGPHGRGQCLRCAQCGCEELEPFDI